MPARANHSDTIPPAGHADEQADEQAAPALCRAIIADPAQYQHWRAQKLAGARRYLAQPFVEIHDPARLSAAELAGLRARFT